jgi:hypothetical protein
MSDEKTATLSDALSPSQLDLRTSLGRASDLRTSLGRLKTEFARQNMWKHMIPCPSLGREFRTRFGLPLAIHRASPPVSGRGVGGRTQFGRPFERRAGQCVGAAKRSALVRLGRSCLLLMAKAGCSKHTGRHEEMKKWITIRTSSP